MYSQLNQKAWAEAKLKGRTCIGFGWNYGGCCGCQPRNSLASADTQTRKSPSLPLDPPSFTDACKELPLPYPSLEVREGKPPAGSIQQNSYNIGWGIGGDVKWVQKKTLSLAFSHNRIFLLYFWKQQPYLHTSPEY